MFVRFRDPEISMGFMKESPHNGVLFFSSPENQGPCFFIARLKSRHFEKDVTTFRQDRNAMAAMVETTGGSHGLPRATSDFIGRCSL